jgi:hypothetical protein
MAKKNKLREGERFNPFGLFHGVYVPDPVFYYSGLSPGAKLCYARLLRYNGSNNKCHPKTMTLAAELHVTERQIQNYLKELSRKAFIQRIAPQQQRNRHLPNDFEFLAHKVFIDAPPKQRRG